MSCPRFWANSTPHSAYIPAKDLESVNEELEGSFSGIGIQFNILNDTINVVSVIPGGPSEKVGILAGDRIVAVDDSAYVGKEITNEGVMKHLKGPKGSTVKLEILRKTSKKPPHLRGDTGRYSGQQCRRRLHARRPFGLHQGEQIRAHHLRRIYQCPLQTE